MKSKTCIIIVTLNGKEYLENCIKSIIKNTPDKIYKIIVVDNGSSDDTLVMLKNKYRRVDIVKNKNNEGFSRANNQGIEYASKKYKPAYFYLLNNDTKVKPQWLIEAIKTAEKSINIGIVGSKQLTFNNKPTISAGWIHPFGVTYYFGDQEKEVQWVSGAGMLIKREVIGRVGFLDEIFSPAYYEETDLEKRTLMAGYKIVYSPKSVFLHKGGTTTANMKENFSKIFYRNRWIFFRKHYSLVFFMPRILGDIIRGIKNKQLSTVIEGYKIGNCLLKNEKN
jgi:GT2 family glycosyltransferase